MHRCPYCHSAERQVKSGFNRTGSQRLQCQACRRRYTPRPNPPGYDDRTRATALKLYLEGNGLRRIGRLLSVNHQSVTNRVNSAHAQLRAKQSDSPPPPAAGTLEMDEPFTFVGSKKARVYRRHRRKGVAARRRARGLRGADAGGGSGRHRFRAARAASRSASAPCFGRSSCSSGAGTSAGPASNNTRAIRATPSISSHV